MTAKFYPESEEFLTVPEILNELKDVLEKPLQEANILLCVKKTGASTLSGLRQKPGTLFALLWFSGVIACNRGVATGRFCLDVEAPPMTGEKTDNQAQVADENILNVIAPLSSLVSIVDFAPKQAAPPQIESSEWIMDGEGKSICGHRIYFTIEFCLPPVIERRNS